VGQGSLYCEYKLPSLTGNYAPIGVVTGSGIFDIDTNNFRYGESNQQPDLTQSLSSVAVKVAGSYINYGTHSVSFNGQTTTTDTPGLLQSITAPASLAIGSGSSYYPLNGSLKRIAYYPVALTAIQLQTLTT
jgi:hypothetical protein